nr:ARL14 effector protein-like isoform X1 [Hydra vulgaris]
MLVVRYEGNQKSCCNPFLSHQKVCREAETIGLNLIPGKKLCPTCRSKVMTCLSKSISENKNDGDFDIVNEKSIQNKKESVDTHFASAGVSPIKVKGLHKSGKIREGKRKLTALTTSIKKKVAISLNI